MKQRIILSVLIPAILSLMISCGSGDKPAGGWQTFTYGVSGEDGLTHCNVKIKVVECYYSSGESGDVELTVVYSALNQSAEPLRFDWAQMYIEDASKHFYESDNGTESRELSNGQAQDELIASYKLPANVAGTGGMDKLHWGPFDENANRLYYRVKLKPEMHY